MNKFIVLSTQRSGSSFVCSLLDSHPRIRCLEEIFMRRNRNAITYRSYRNASLRRRLEHLLERRRSIESYLAGVYDAQPDLDAVGFKLMYEQVQRYPELVDWCRSNDVMVVHLIRMNALKTIVSRQVALKRGVYLSTKPVKPVTVSLNTSRLVPELERAARLVDTNRSIFSSLPYTELFYEHFLARRGEELGRVLSFLGCDDDVQLTSDLVKTSPDSLATLIDNYEDVRRRLAGTRFEPFLEQEGAA